MVLTQVCFLYLHNQCDPNEPQAENLLSHSLGLGGPKCLAEACGHLEHLLSLQTDSNGVMPLVRSPDFRDLKTCIWNQWKTATPCFLCLAWETGCK